MGGMSYYNPYWGKALQNQQKAQPKPEAKQSRQQGDNGGFDSLIVGRACSIELGNGKTIKGVVSAASKYFYLISIDGQVTIVNKAFVVSITPIQGQNAGGGREATNKNQGGGVDVRGSR